MHIDRHQYRLASSSLSSPQRRARGSVFVRMFGPMAKLPAVIGQSYRARQASAQLAVLDDRMLADIGLRRGDVYWAARGGLDHGRGGLAQSRLSLAAVAVVSAAVVGLSFAAAPARAASEAEGRGDPFPLHVPGEVFSTGPTRQAQAGTDAGPPMFSTFAATPELRAAPAPQALVGPFALRTRP